MVHTQIKSFKLFEKITLPYMGNNTNIVVSARKGEFHTFHDSTNSPKYEDWNVICLKLLNY